MTWLEITLVCVIASGVCYYLAAWLFKKDTESENRRRGAVKLASVLSALGLKKIPKFLEDYAVGDLSGMAHSIKELVELFVNGEEAVLAEFSQVFESCLVAKLKTETGRAYVAAKLSDAAEASDPSVVADAPTANVA